jgi:protocatechuate 3,4-dioxygenase beta subunit
MSRIAARTLLAAVAVLALALSGHGQGLRTGVISGQVVDGHGAPITDALVTLVRPGIQERVVVDPRGRFIFRNLPQGAFGVVATRPGYLGGGIDQRLPPTPGRPVELAEGQSLTNLTLRLWKGAAITGTVLSGNGEPIAGVEMLALRRSLVGGRWMISTGPTTTTDDLGRYRFDGLASGDYVVAARPDSDPDTALLLAMLSANPAQAADVLAAATAASRARPEPDERMRNYPLTFYPDAPTTSGATLVHVEPESERTKTDLRLKLSSAVRVSGTLSERVDGVTLQLVPVGTAAGSAAIESSVTACDEEGAFEFTGVTPGRYLIRVALTPPAAAGPPGQPLPATAAYSGSTQITVGLSDVSNVSVPVRRGVAMSGRVVFAGASAPPPPAQLTQIALRLDPVDRAMPPGAAAWRGQVDPDGQFKVMSLPPGEYLLRVGAPPGWTPLSAISAGHDLLDVPVAAIGTSDITDVTITFTDGPAAAAVGVVQDATGVTSTNATVVVFPTDRAMWRDSSAQARRLRLGRATASGRFGVPNLPPGEYFVIAINGEVPAEWQDPAMLNAWTSTATRVQLQGGPPQPMTLRVTPGPKAPAPRQAGRTNPAASKAQPQPGRRPPKTGAASATGAALAGTVVDQITRRPAANATVLVAGTDVGLLRVTSADDRGQFQFTGLPAGHFLVGAGKAGYLPAVLGANRPGRPGTPVALETGQRVGDLALQLVRGAVIAGQVTGDNGQPVPGARVRVVQRRAAGGEVAMIGDAGDPVTVTTDDRGGYRVFNLPAGEYAVLVQARGLAGGDVRRLTESDVDATTSPAPAPLQQANGMSMAWTAAYAPGTASPADALAIALEPGDMRTGVNVRTTLTRLVRVDGRVSSRDQIALPSVQITLRPKHLAASGIIPTNLTARPGPEGRFVFPNVPPGEYTMLARTAPPPDAPSASVLWAGTDVVVREESLADIALELQNSLTVSGELRMENGARLPPDLPIIRVGVRPTPGSGLPNPPPIDVPRHGQFKIEGLVPGRYRFFVQVPNDAVLQVPAWFAKTATPSGVNAGDALDVPFDVAAGGEPQIVVTLTDTTQEVDGVVRDAAGAPKRDCTVIVFATDRAFWFQQSRRIAIRQTGRDGRFVFGIAAGLPAGEYYVAAVPDGRPGDQLDVLLLEELARTAERLTLNADETKTVELKIK